MSRAERFTPSPPDCNRRRWLGHVSRAAALVGAFPACSPDLLAPATEPNARPRPRLLADDAEPRTAAAQWTRKDSRRADVPCPYSPCLVGALATWPSAGWPVPGGNVFQLWGQRTELPSVRIEHQPCTPDAAYATLRDACAALTAMIAARDVGIAGAETGHVHLWTAHGPDAWRLVFDPGCWHHQPALGGLPAPFDALNGFVNVVETTAPPPPPDWEELERERPRVIG